MYHAPPQPSDPVCEAATVWIVEDDDDYRRALEMVITAAGFPVQSFASPTDLINCYRPQQPGCLVLDLRTPQMDAIELYERLVQLGGAHPFIVISAHGSIPRVAQIMRGGAIDFLTKPVDHGVLIERIREAVDADRTRRDLAQRQAAVSERLRSLSKREREVLDLVTLGLASKQIAARLDIGTKTVDVHRSNIMKKMSVDSFVQLARLLAKHSLLR